MLMAFFVTFEENGAKTTALLSITSWARSNFCSSDNMHAWKRTYLAKETHRKTYVHELLQRVDHYKSVEYRIYTCNLHL